MSSEILGLQKGLYEYMKKKASEFEVEESPMLLSFKENQEEFASRDFTKSNIDELIKSIESSDVIFLGDFHTFDQQSRNLERLLKSLVQKNKKLLLGVEFIQQDKQRFIDDYSSHTISAMELLELTNYSDSWRFPWHVYRPFFDMARNGEVEIFALNTKGNLKERDKSAAKKIKEITEKNKDAKLLVFFGELHIAPNMLPLEVKTLCPNQKQTIIHQNLDQVYWKLNDPDDQVVRFNHNEFSLQTSPPWIKYESMINWYENLCEDPSFDLHQYQQGAEQLALNSNVPENFHFICEELSSSLLLNLKSEDLEDFNLIDYNQLSIINEKIEKLPSQKLKSFYKTLIARSKSFHLPGTNYLYCSNYSMNRLSFLAGVHLFETVQRLNEHEHEKTDCNDSITFFLRFSQQNLIGHFSSKLINPYRKCDMYENFTRTLEADDKDSYDYKNAKLFVNILKNKKSPEKLKKLLISEDTITLFYVGRFIGKFLGEVLYLRIFNDKELLERYQEIKERLFVERANLDNFLAFTNLIIPNESYKSLRKRSF